MVINITLINKNVSFIQNFKNNKSKSSKKKRQNNNDHFAILTQKKKNKRKPIKNNSIDKELIAQKIMDLTIGVRISSMIISLSMFVKLRCLF